MKKETKIKKETKNNTQLLGTEEKKIMQPFGTKKSVNLSVPKKIMQPLRTKKSGNLLVQQKVTQPFGATNVLKIPILATIEIHEIGTDHLGLVLRECLPPSCHVSGVRCQVSCVTFSLYFFLLFSGQSGGASCWRVCYHWGLPRLVYFVSPGCSPGGT